MPGQGNRVESFEDYMNEAESLLSNADHSVTRMVDLLEDGGTEWDERVKKVQKLVDEANKEMRVISKQFRQNKPKEPFVPRFTGNWGGPPKK